MEKNCRENTNVTIALGTTSNDKLQILRRSLARLGSDRYTIRACAIESGVPDQPVGEEEIATGSYNRARGALHLCLDAEFGIGMEGGLVKSSNGSFSLICICTALDRKNHKVVGHSSKAVIPRPVCEGIRRGEQFGEAIREYEKMLLEKGTTQEDLNRVESLISRSPYFEEALEVILSSRCFGKIGNNIKKPVLYIMCGLPFSGKSTLAKKISEIKGYKVVEIDEIKTGLNLRDKWKDMKSDDWQKIFDESFELVRNELGSGHSVIHDSANQTKFSRDQLREVAKECGCESKIIFMEISEEEARKRWQQNENSLKRMRLPEWAFNAAVSNYEISAGEPGVIVYQQSYVPEEWITRQLTDKQNGN